MPHPDSTNHMLSQELFPDALFQEVGLPPAKRFKSTSELSIFPDEVMDYKRKTGMEINTRLTCKSSSLRHRVSQY